MRSKIKSFWIMAVATLLMASVAGASEIGKPAPDFELTDTAGKTHKLSDYQGKILVIHYHAVKCPWDIAYQPILNDVAKQYQDKNVVFLGINSNKTEPMEMLKKDVTKKDIPYAVVKDPGNKVADAYGAATTPHMFIVDAQGVLRYKGGVEAAPGSPDEVGKSSEQYLVPALDALIAGNQPEKAETRSKGCTIKR